MLKRSMVSMESTTHAFFLPNSFSFKSKILFGISTSFALTAEGLTRPPPLLGLGTRYETIGGVPGSKILLTL